MQCSQVLVISIAASFIFHGIQSRPLTDREIVKVLNDVLQDYSRTLTAQDHSNDGFANLADPGVAVRGPDDPLEFFVIKKDGTSSNTDNRLTKITSTRPTLSTNVASSTSTDTVTTSRPKTSRATISQSTISRSTTSRPTTSRPTTSRPTTSRPTTSRPTTSRPTTSRPTTSQPTTSQPTTSQPTTSQPTTSQPTTSRPTTSQTTTSRPTTSRPTTSTDITITKETTAPKTRPTTPNKAPIGQKFRQITMNCGPGDKEGQYVSGEANSVVVNINVYKK
ncbi:salivary glue protein Sgs-3-like [Clytia hemisphaerica]|uniref:Cnidarian restricted protein n=1 Tax=Clytia hemisphaerica TaxID=252671 RepID=A0A7M5V6N4_9CNID